MNPHPDTIDPDGRDHFLFSGISIRSPLEELQAIGEKKLRTLENLGEREKAELHRRAFEMAGIRLAAVLGQEIGQES